LGIAAGQLRGTFLPLRNGKAGIAGSGKLFAARILGRFLVTFGGRGHHAAIGDGDAVVRAMREKPPTAAAVSARPPSTATATRLLSMPSYSSSSSDRARAGDPVHQI
jgi:hypothetical protein